MLTRFAPSPTGLLHLGNIRTALICYLYSKKNNGSFMLRIDDTDVTSCKPEYQECLKEDLSWIGLKWDLSIKQSQRIKRYNQVFNQLIESKRIYECYENAEELEVKRKMLINKGLAPIYTSESVNEEQREKYKNEGRKAYFRFKINRNDVISWQDQIRSKITFLGAHLSDPVVMRTNGLYTYMLPSVIDDIDYKITHIIRGEDHIANTAIQIQMIKALKAICPEFAHLSLLKSGNAKLSKRYSAINARSLKKDGIEPMAINSYLATIGSSNQMIMHTDLIHLIKTFNINNFSSSAILLNIKDIESLNKEIIRNIPFSEIYSRLDIEALTEEFWHGIRFNIKTIHEVRNWWRICKTEITNTITDKDFIDIAYSTLPIEPWDKNTWHVWSSELKKITGRRKKDLFMPLRLALTGENTGPELAKLLPLIGRVLARIRLKT